MAERLREVGYPPTLLDRVDVLIEREGGLIEAFVPIQLIDRTDVSVDNEHVRELAASIQKEAEQQKTTGQLSPVILAEIPDFDKLIIIDGFHRITALELLTKEKVFSTIKPGCTREEAIDLRIVSATSHKSVKFSRIVEWVEEAWEKTPWADRLGVSSAFQLRFLSGTNGSRSGLAPEEAEEIRVWVDRKCTQWDISAPYIDRYLRTARSADPQLVKEARERKNGHKLEAITPRHLETMVKFLPHKYELQRIVAQAATQHSLTVPQTRALALAVSKAEDVDHAQKVIESKAWQSLDAVTVPLIKKRYKEIDSNSPDSFTEVLVDKFFDDQVAIAQLMIENAILTGNYIPHGEGQNPRLNTLILTSGFKEEELEPQPGETIPWDSQKIDEVSRGALQLRPSMISFLRRKFGLRLHDAEDVVSVAVERLLARVNDGRLSQSYADKKKFLSLMMRFTNYAAIDHFRKESGREGQKSKTISLDVENEDGSSLADILGEEDEGFNLIDRSNIGFIKNILPYLNERERRILILKGYFGLTHYEIAQVIGTTELTIHTYFNKAKQKILKLNDNLQ